VSARLSVSPTALKLGRRCLRRWGFDRLGGRKEPSTQALSDGTAYHAVAEGWLQGQGLVGPEAMTRLVEEGIPYLPPPGECQVEVSWSVELAGCLFGGKIDWVWPAGQQKGDHKFVRGYDYPADLATDEQSVLYTLAPPVWEVTDLLWLYYSKTKNVKEPVRPIRYQMTQAKALEVLHALFLPTAQDMAWLFREFQPIPIRDRLPLINMIPCDQHDCWSFTRPCPQADICTR
jgi:hypothetical protein